MNALAPLTEPPISQSLAKALESPKSYRYTDDGYGGELVEEPWRLPAAPPEVRAEAGRVLRILEPQTARADKGIVAKWLGSLGVLCAGQMSAADAKAKLGAYSALLDYPAGCFTEASLRDAATRFKWFPAFAEVAEFLDEVAKPIRQKADRLAKIAGAPDEPKAFAPAFRRLVPQRSESNEEWRERKRRELGIDPNLQPVDMATKAVTVTPRYVPVRPPGLEEALAETLSHDTEAA